MSGFLLTLLDGRTAQRIAGVVSLVAADASGQFGLLPGHAPLVTVLEPGLFRYRVQGQPSWTYVACVGGLLRCARGEVTIVSGRFVQNQEPEALQRGLDTLMLREAALRVSTRESQEQVDAALLKRMQELAESSR